jgi:23S rRNA pseudouridine1911/1915/1917 synthase
MPPSELAHLGVAGEMPSLFDILHEDADLLVVHKPADLVCHPTKGDVYSSLISRARIYLGSGSLGTPLPGHTPDQGQSVPHLIHRLDRETSGVVLLAKNAAAAGELGRIWETRAVQKDYLAIVHGHPTANEGIIDAPLGKDENSPVAIKDCVRSDGHPARTEFVVEQRFYYRRGPGAVDATPGASSPEPRDGAPFSLLRVHPLTGRKHQIRIHLAYLGHPIVGDKIYGGNPDLYLALVENRLTSEQRSQLILPHQALHACRLRFGWRGQACDFQAAPEPAFAAFIAGGSPVKLCSAASRDR